MATPPLGPPRAPGRAAEDTTVTSVRMPDDQTASAFGSQCVSCSSTTRPAARHVSISAFLFLQLT
eukprot:774490-Lingulodinium_polyedra.AAC.1